jgi:hypothetical protein
MNMITQQKDKLYLCALMKHGYHVALRQFT